MWQRARIIKGALEGRVVWVTGKPVTQEASYIGPIKEFRGRTRTVTFLDTHLRFPYDDLHEGQTMIVEMSQVELQGGEESFREYVTPETLTPQDLKSMFGPEHRAYMIETYGLTENEKAKVH